MLETHETMPQHTRTQYKKVLLIKRLRQPQEMLMCRSNSLLRFSPPRNKAVHSTFIRNLECKKTGFFFLQKFNGSMANPLNNFCLQIPFLFMIWGALLHFNTGQYGTKHQTLCCPRFSATALHPHPCESGKQAMADASKNRQRKSIAVNNATRKASEEDRKNTPGLSKLQP